MSPEQLHSSKDVDGRSDIWSLGIILFELLTGNAPFNAETMASLVLQIVSAPPQALRSGRPELPIGLEEVVFKCLEKDRERRYANVGDFAVALAPFGTKRARASVLRITALMREAGTSTTVLPSSDPARPAGAESTSWGRTTFRHGRRSWMLFVFAGALLVAGVAFVASRGRAVPGGAAMSGVNAASAPLPEMSPAPLAPAVTATTVVSAATLDDAPKSPVAVVPVARAEQVEKAAGAPAKLVTRAQSSPESKPAGAAPARPAAPPSGATGDAPVAPPAESHHALVPPPGSPPAPSDDCTQRFYFDAQGNKHFKAHCFADSHPR
jgi:serine/threonine-protein kinase